jgi:hypothetical protein
MSLKFMRLELARDHDFPDGSTERGYEIVAPLDVDGHLNASEWHKLRERCKVRRFWAGAEEMGRLVHRPGGSWAVDYNPATTEDDEPGFRLDKHQFNIGEYVSFKEHDGVMRTFRVVALEDIPH